MIVIDKSATADTRTCDYANVSKGTLLLASMQHVSDVIAGMQYIVRLMEDTATQHDADKFDNIDGFHSDFVGGFKSTTWWDNHRKINRHHLNNDDGVPADVNLIDVLEHIVDCVMAGKARSGKLMFPVVLPDGLLQRALKNTVELLDAEVVIKDENNDFAIRRKYVTEEDISE